MLSGGNLICLVRLLLPELIILVVRPYQVRHCIEVELVTWTKIPYLVIGFISMER